MRTKTCVKSVAAKIPKKKKENEKKSSKNTRKESRQQNLKMCRLQQELQTESKLRNKAELNVIACRNRATTLWECWRWELEKRREAMISELCLRRSGGMSGLSTTFRFQEVNPTMLLNPIVCDEEKEHYVGRGSFGIVRAQVFRDILVAVKEYLPRSLTVDVMHET